MSQNELKQLASANAYSKYRLHYRVCNQNDTETQSSKIINIMTILITLIIIIIQFSFSIANKLLPNI